MVDKDARIRDRAEYIARWTVGLPVGAIGLVLALVSYPFMRAADRILPVSRPRG